MDAYLDSEFQISVVIPVYKDLSGLKKTIDSILHQSYTNFEIIVVNDGGDPAIDEFCTSNAIKTTSIIPNKGSYNARNEGIRIARTPYIAFTDADLIVHREWLRRGIEYLVKYDYVAGNVIVDETQVVDIATYHDYVTAFPVQNYFNKFHFGVTANLFVKKSIFDKVGLFDSELRSGGDLEFGDRVYRGGMSQYYTGDCLVIHPPRSHAEKKIKIRRVRAGQIDLFNKYPDRFPYFKRQNSIRRLISAITPPSWSSVKKIHNGNCPYTKWEIFRYLYCMKIIRSYNYYIQY